MDGSIGLPQSRFVGRISRPWRWLLVTLTVALLFGLAFWLRPYQDSPTPAAPKAPLPALNMELCSTPGLSIRRVVSDDPHDPQSTVINETALKASNRRLMSLLVPIFGEYPCRMDFVAPLPDGRYDVILTGATDYESAQPLLARALREAFGLKVHVEERETDVLVLSAGETTRPAGLRQSSLEARSQFITTDVGPTFTAYDMDEFADWIEHRMWDKPVINETGLDGQFDFHLPWDAMFEPQKIPAQVASLGLQLKPGRRRINILVFTSAGSTPTTTNPFRVGG